MLKAAGLLFAAFGSAMAQAPLPWSWCELPDASATVLAVRWHGGFDLDAPGECGAGRVLAECRLQRARAAVPAVRASGFTVRGTDAIAFVLVDAADWPQAQRFVEHLLDDGLPLDDDTIDLAIARAALEADDAESLYPGQVLASLARTGLLAGTIFAHGVAGDSRAIQRLSRARVRQLSSAPTAAAAFGAGNVPDALRSALEGRFRCGPAAAADPSPAIATPPAAGPRPLATVVQARPKAPFVAAAFAVPAEVDRPALAVGLEVARARAVRALPPVPEELLARANRVQWAWIEADPLVVFCLRAPSGRTVEAPRAALERLLAGLRDAPPSAGECTAAAQVLQAQLGLPPWSSAQQRVLASTPEALPGKAIAALSAGARGIGANVLSEVEPGAVHRALSATLAAEAAFWAAVVLPQPVRTPVPAGRR